MSQHILRFLPIPIKSYRGYEIRSGYLKLKWNVAVLEPK